ncbi:uncharacterized protein LOC124639196 [Helicoverpa zea]|uniref:uncharacterized protein LOC124639196 n=1 Tax=Helicoverpa zea TaxID=7113 RepID=UPI001F57D5FD|nr:uncharacterized protein LOC124639196 [Helicoverpa zea]
MPGVNCHGCGRFMVPAEGAKCGKCKMAYHRGCVGVVAKGVVPAGWRCPECKKNLLRDNRADTPVRGLAESPPCSSTSPVEHTSVVPSSPNTRTVSCSSPLPETVGQQSASLSSVPPAPQAGSDLTLVEELRAMRADLLEFRSKMLEEMMDLKLSMQSCNTRIDGLEARINALEQRRETSPSTHSSVEGIVEELRRELNDRDQDLLSNDIEISNIPESTADNPVHIAKVIGLKLGVTLEERDIVSAERVGGRQLNATSSAGPAVPRPRAIVVRLARRDVRDQLLASARVRRGATTADLDMSGPPQRFFLNERLTKTNRRLFRKARDAASLFSWRFVWTKRGRILARKGPGDSTQRIRTDEDIAATIGSVNETT